MKERKGGKSPVPSWLSLVELESKREGGGGEEMEGKKKKGRLLLWSRLVGRREENEKRS